MIGKLDAMVIAPAFGDSLPTCRSATALPGADLDEAQRERARAVDPRIAASTSSRRRR